MKHKLFRLFAPLFLDSSSRSNFFELVKQKNDVPPDIAQYFADHYGTRNGQLIGQLEAATALYDDLHAFKRSNMIEVKKDSIAHGLATFAFDGNRNYFEVLLDTIQDDFTWVNVFEQTYTRLTRRPANPQTSTAQDIDEIFSMDYSNKLIAAY